MGLKQSALCIHGFRICGFNQPQMKNIWEKNSRKSQKAKLNLLHTGNYLQSIYIVFMAIYVAFALH